MLIKIQFTLHERDLLLNVLGIDLEIESLLRLALLKNNSISIEIKADDLDLMLGFIAADANHTKNMKLAKELHALFARLSDILENSDHLD